MKRILMIALMLTALCSTVRAQLWSFEYDSTYYRCENFGREMPDEAVKAFSGALMEGDEVICGAKKTVCFVREDREDRDTSILMAVRREGKILLMHASGINDDFEVTVESDSFLQADAQFTIETDAEDRGTLRTHRINAGDAAYWVSRRSFDGNRLWITRAERKLEDGTTLVLIPSDGHLSWQIRQNGMERKGGNRAGVFPNRLAAWTEDSFPKTKEEAYDWMDAHAPAIDGDEAYIIAVNLRERATGESPSWGKYTAKVRILDEAPGITAPWYQVDVGGLIGWVSGDYLMKADIPRSDRLYDAAAHVPDAACVRTDTALCRTPDGVQIRGLEKGMLMHVLGERNGWLHVIMPREEPGWNADWDGEYGFVRTQDVSVGVSAADAWWKAEMTGE